MRKADNLPTSCAVVTKYGNLNFLEPSGPVQACNGTALPFYTGMRGVLLGSPGGDLDPLPPPGLPKNAPRIPV